jgi:hypothetical protein
MSRYIPNCPLKIVIDILIQVCYFPFSNKFLLIIIKFHTYCCKSAIFAKNNLLIPFLLNYV